MTCITLSETSKVPLEQQVEIMSSNEDLIIAYRSHRNGDVLCGDCASNEEAETDGDHTVLGFVPDPEGVTGYCDECGATDWE